MAPDTPERFTLAASARRPRQDQTRFSASTGCLFRSDRAGLRPELVQTLRTLAGRVFVMQDVQFIECVAERDIDLLLLEELHVSAAFRVWLVGQAFGQDVCCTRFLAAWHSVSHPTLG